MKAALIATVFNEADNLSDWWTCIAGQTVRPDEIVIVDGGSSDGTWEMLQTFAGQSPIPVRLEQQRCNIAAGRNIAIQMTDAEIIASSDAGSFPQADWFGQITRPLLSDPAVNAVGGFSKTRAENDFQRLVASFRAPLAEPNQRGDVYPSSRNVAFRRAAWLAVGGYPEWLTLTTEDALFNRNLHKIGCRFSYSPRAVVSWPIREDARSHFRMVYAYGYGAAEARLFVRQYVSSVLISLCPPLLLLSRHRAKGLWFRYKEYVIGSAGWVAGLVCGHRPPAGWRRFEGVLLSPEAQECMTRRN